MASSSSSSSSSSSGASTPPKPQLDFPQKKPFLGRLFPFFLAANLAVGVYVLIKTSEKTDKKDEEAMVDITSAPPASVTAIPIPVKALPPITEDEQRQLFKWMLEEKRKVKPSNPSEKKKIDEEKALLKEFIRSKSIPSL